MGFNFASDSIDVSRGCVFRNDNRIAFLRWNLTGTISCASATLAWAASARCCERSANDLVLARDLELAARSRRSRASGRRRISPSSGDSRNASDGGVVHRVGAREGAVGLGHHEGCARHALHAAAMPTAPRRTGSRARAGPRLPCRSRRAGSRWPPGHRPEGREQERMRPTLRLSSPAWLAHPVEDVVEGCPIHVGIALHELGDGNGAEVVGSKPASAPTCVRRGVRMASQMKVRPCGTLGGERRARERHAESRCSSSKPSPSRSPPPRALAESRRSRRGP